VIAAIGPIGRDPAQRLARQELNKAIYHQGPSIPVVIARAIRSFLTWIFGHASQITPGGSWTVVALVALAAVLVVVAIRIGPLARTARRSAPVHDSGSRPLPAAQLRDASIARAAEGDYSTAILQRLRAIAASCEERGVLAPDAGRTADELAAQAGALFRGHAADLAAAARLFDEILYGDGTGTADGYARLRDLDDALAALSPARTPAPEAAAVGSTP
jgi:hypothetical protein